MENFDLDDERGHIIGKRHYGPRSILKGLKDNEGKDALREFSKAHTYMGPYEDEEIFEITNVQAKCKRKGHGTSLMNECIQAAKEEGYKRIVLFANPEIYEEVTMDVLREFYLKCGFTEISEDLDPNHATFVLDLKK